MSGYTRLIDRRVNISTSMNVGVDVHITTINING